VRRVPLLVLAAGLAAGRLAGQGSARPVRPPPPVPQPGQDLTISLMTMGVGEASWERYGHNAIVVEDRRRGTRISYNYGMFSFRQENFLLRFIQGRMLYWVDGLDTDWDIQRYQAARRAVWVQELNLTPAERAALRDFLEWNTRPANRYYRYDYYRDNCSTRVRDALDRVLGGAIRRQTDTVATGVTYRFETQRLNADNLALYTGLMLAVGPRADQPLNAWDQMFLPLALHARIRDIRVPDAQGNPVPLVLSERTVVESHAFPVPDQPPDWIPGFLAAGLLLGGLLAGTGLRARSQPVEQHWGARLSFLLLAGLWCAVSGLGGLVLTGLWAFTDHTIAVGNQNVMQVNLLALALLPLLGASFRPATRRGAAARGLALVIAGVAVVGLLIKLVPGLHQGNGEIVAFALPVNLGLAAGMLLRRSALGSGKR
jgi:Domain of unknown function (DUF4105)